MKKLLLTLTLLTAGSTIYSGTESTDKLFILKTILEAKGDIGKMIAGGISDYLLFVGPGPNREFKKLTVKPLPGHGSPIVFTPEDLKNPQLKKPLEKLIEKIRDREDGFS